MIKSLGSFLTSLMMAALLVPSAMAQDETSLPLWEVKNGDRTVFLMGSVHLLRPQAYPLDDALYRAFDQAEEVVFEVDYGELMSGAAVFAQRGMLSGIETLADLLPDELYGELIARASDFGLPGEAVNRMKPWMASLTLSSMVVQAGGYEVGAGIDHHFYERARESAKSVAGLETVEEQLDVFDGLDREQQIAMLESTLDDLDTTVEMLDRATHYWQTGNAEGLAEMFKESMGGQASLLDRLLYQRNQNWIPRIEALLTGDKDAIVIVGMGHLVGEGSVVELLEARGYSVVQVIDEG